MGASLRGLDRRRSRTSGPWQALLSIRESLGLVVARVSVPRPGQVPVGNSILGGTITIVAMILILPLIGVMQPSRSTSGWRPDFGTDRGIGDRVTALLNREFDSEAMPRTCA
jgi:hypothetical protein